MTGRSRRHADADLRRGRWRHRRARRFGGLDRRGRRARVERRQRETRVVLREDGFDCLASARATAGANHAHPHAVAVANASEANAVAAAGHRERRTAEQPRPDRHAEGISRNRVRAKAWYVQPGDATGVRPPVDLDVAKPIASEPCLDQRLADLGERERQDPRHLVLVHIVRDRSEIRELRATRPDVGRALGPAAARRGVEDVDRLAIERQHPACGGQRRAPRDLVGAAHDLTVCGVAEVESFTAMAALVHDGVGANRHRERLLSGIGSAGLGLAGQNTRDVRFKRECRDAPIGGQETDVNRAPRARALQCRIADVGLRGCPHPDDRCGHDEHREHPECHSFRSHPGRQLHGMACSPSV